MNTKIFIISDCHGNIDGLRRALMKKLIIDNHGDRLLESRHKVYSIGDLANCVGSSIQGDKDCLDLVGNVIDGMLVGNHEMPYFDPKNDFGGFKYDFLIDVQLHKLLDADLIGASLLVDNTLITHAGVTKQVLPTPTITAIGVHNKIEEHWKTRNYGYSLFSSCGKERGGNSTVGGMLWCDFEKEFVPTSFPQIVGHTPKYVRMKGNALCIDVGAKNQNTEPFILEMS